MAVFSAISGAIAGDAAADAIRQGNQEAAQTQREMYRTNLRLLSPQYTTGQSAMFQLADLYGLDRPSEYTRVEDVIGRHDGRPSFFGGFGGADFAEAYEEGGDLRGMMSRMRNRGGGGRAGAGGGLTDVPADERRAAAMEKFFTSPDYTFRLDEGLKALDRSAAARGQMLSGAHLKGLTRFSQDLASSEYQNYVNRLASMAGMGQTASGRATNLGAGMANNVSSLQADTGAARASGYLTAAQGIQSGVQNTMDFISSNPGSVGLPVPGG